MPMTCYGVSVTREKRRRGIQGFKSSRFGLDPPQLPRAYGPFGRRK